MKIRKHDLSEKVSRKPNRSRILKNKIVLNISVEERPDINNRLEFAHWETDLVIGQKDKSDEALLTLLERNTRKYMLIKIANKSAKAVWAGFTKVRDYFGSKLSEVFKTNG